MRNRIREFWHTKIRHRVLLCWGHRWKLWIRKEAYESWHNGYISIGIKDLSGMNIISKCFMCGQKNINQKVCPICGTPRGGVKWKTLRY